MSVDPLELLFEAEKLPAFDLPPELASVYGGTLGFTEPRLVANFVATLDGVVSIPGVAASNRLIAAGSPADRFVMGLLRACCEAVMIGAGTLSASPNSTWTPTRAFPDAAEGFADLRRRLGYQADPLLVVLTASGGIAHDHPALEAGALVLTTDAGSSRLAGRLPAPAEVRSIGAGSTLEPKAIMAELATRGHRLVLSEGGPHSIGPLVAAGLVDELFLTLSPLLLGRSGDQARLGLIESADLLGDPPSARLLGVRRSGDHLFLRYELLGAASANA